MSRKFACCFKVMVLVFMVILLSTTRLLAEENGKAIADPIMIDTGLISGKKISETGNEVRAYLGIPYAAPPVGDLRWEPPQPVIPWSGVRDATQYSKSAPQGSDSPWDSLPQDEDCLYLNVITPAKHVNEKLPVMLWLHPGGYFAGSGNDPLFNSYRLPQSGVIVVTVNMRLGVFGLMAHPELSEKSSRGVSGNYMFLDILASLEWVKKNIVAFGGDPDNVTIFGQSGGGWKVAALVSSPLSKGFFKRGICQSGPAAPGMPLSDLEKMGSGLFAKLNVTTLEEARKIPWEDIVKADMDLGTDTLWTMAIDGWFINDDPDSIFSAGNQNAVQMMVGLNQGELSPEPAASYFISKYVNMLSGVRKKGMEGYAYIFDQVPANWRKQGGVAIHALDCAYVFGAYDDPTLENWSQSYKVESLDYGVGPEDKEPALSEADKKVSEAMMAMWAQFARTGNPSVKGLITVSAWAPHSDKYLCITDPLQIKTGFTAIASAEENTAGISEKKPQVSDNKVLNSDGKTGSLIIKLTDFKDTKGKAVAYLYDTKENYDEPEAAFRNAEVEIKDNTAEIVFKDIPLGTYAIMAFHDENDNKKFDTNMFGLPQEQYGFSNNAFEKFGAPKWENATFSFDKAEDVIEIKVNYHMDHFKKGHSS